MNNLEPNKPIILVTLKVYCLQRFKTSIFKLSVFKLPKCQYSYCQYSIVKIQIGKLLLLVSFIWFIWMCECASLTE